MSKGRSLFTLAAALALSFCLGGCALPGDAMRAASPDDLVTATIRVDQAIDAANACVGDYMRRYDSPSITPGDVLDAALIECQPFFRAHHAAVHMMTAIRLHQEGDREAETRAEQEAERYSNSFRRIVRETGLTVLVQRRSPLSTLAPHSDERELQL